MSLIYDVSYHLRCKLVLASGRDVIVERLHQSQTYAGLLEGFPDARMNDRHIEAALERARSLCSKRENPYLITPVRRSFLRKPGDMVSLNAAGNVAEWLPQVTCFARFKSHQPARDPTKDISMLTVVWYQEEFALPILEPALSSLVGLDWSMHATDEEW